MSTEYLIDEHKAPTTRRNHVGIEIECLIKRSNYQKIKDHLVKKDLQWNVNVGTDGSVVDDTFVPRYELRRDAFGTNQVMINRDEQPTGSEIRILAEESDAPEIIDSVCETLDKYKARVNKTCGLHVHLDMRKRDFEKVFNNFYFFQDLLFQTQAKHRRDNNYCIKLKSKLKGMPQARYYAINKLAYEKHKTLEIRLHEGAVDAKSIKFWVGLLIKIADMKETLKKKAESFDMLDIPNNVREHFNERIRKNA